jgi:hypothetical protein
MSSAIVIARLVRAIQLWHKGMDRPDKPGDDGGWTDYPQMGTQ